MNVKPIVAEESSRQWFVYLKGKRMHVIKERSQ